MKAIPIAIPDRDFLLWLAGFMDGEGSFIVSSNIQRRPYGEYPSFIRAVQVSNTDLTVLEHIRDTLQAGKIRDYARYPSWAKGQGRWKPAYILTFNSDQGRALAAMLLPFLRIKREQAEIIANWPNKARGGSHTGRDLATHEAQRALHERIKALNQRGVH